MTDERLRYQRWVHRHMPSVETLSRQRLAAQRLTHRPLISIITPVYNTPPDFLRRLLASVRHQSYPFWEHCLVDDGSSESWLTRRLEHEAARDPRVRFRRREANGGITAASNDALALATGELIAFVDHDDEIEPDALYEIALAVNAQPNVDVLYSDFDVIDLKGLRSNPACWPSWSPERLETIPYTVHLRVLRRTLVLEAGGLRASFDGAQDYDLALRAREITERVVHIPRILYHWRAHQASAALSPEAKPYASEANGRALSEALERRQVPGVRAPGPAPNYHHIRFDRTRLPAVSIVAASVDAREVHQPTIQPFTRLAASLARLIEQADPAPLECVVAVTSRDVAAAQARLTSLPVPVRIVEAATGATAATALNLAAARATGELLLIRSEDLAPLDDDWLSQLAGYASRPAVGVAAPKVSTPADMIEHAGIVLPHGRPHPVLRGIPAASIVHHCTVRIVCNYSAASGACLMTRRALFAEVGGFRPEAEVGYSDVDYCLRLRERGYRIVVSGYAELRQIQAPPPVPDDEEQARLAAFRRAWPSLPEVDPYYNPNFDQDSGSFRLADD